MVQTREEDDPRTGLRLWSVYVVTSAALVAFGGFVAGWWVVGSARAGMWAGLGAAWLVQALAFGVLLATAGRKPGHFVAGWTVGTFLRLITLGVVAWLTVALQPLAPLPTLLALAAALFVLLLLEPVVFRLGLGMA